VKEGQKTHWTPFLGYGAKFKSDLRVEVLIAEEVNVCILPCVASRKRP